MSVDEQYGVRIRRPDDMPVEASGGLASMLAPIVGQDVDDLERSLIAGEVLVAQRLPRDEAAQFTTVLSNLGAASELVRRYGGEWIICDLPVVKTGSPIHSTVPFDGDDLRQIEQRTRRFTPEQVERLSPGNATQPLNLSQMSVPPLEPTTQPFAGRAGGKKKTTDRWQNLPDTPPPVAKKQTISSEALGLMATLSPLPKGAQSPLFTPPSVRKADVEVHNQIDLTAQIRQEAERLRAQGAPLTAQYQSPSPDFGSAVTQPFHQGGPLLPAATRQHGLPQSQSQPQPGDDRTQEFNRRRARIFQTGSIGSLAGPKIFSMQSPPPALSQTGSAVRPLRLTLTSENLTALHTEELTPAQLSALRSLMAESAPETDVVPASRVIQISGPIVDALEMPIVRPLGPEPAQPTPAPAEPIDEPIPVSHSPANAGLAGLIPGMGQVYNGQRDRGIAIALGAVLIIPWLYGIVDAIKVAAKIRAGQHPAPDGSRRFAAFAQLAVVLSVVCGMVLGWVLWHRIRPPQTPTPIVITAPAPEAPKIKKVEIKQPAPPIDTVKLDRLMTRGRDTCRQQLFAECALIMEAALALDPQNTDAKALLKQAVQKSR